MVFHQVQILSRGKWHPVRSFVDRLEAEDFARLLTPRARVKMLLI